MLAMATGATAVPEDLLTGRADAGELPDLGPIGENSASWEKGAPAATEEHPGSQRLLP